MINVSRIALNIRFFETGLRQKKRDNKTKRTDDYLQNGKQWRYMKIKKKRKEINVHT